LSRDIYHIASDYLSGRINSEERQYFLQWLEASQENKALFAELKNVWELTGSLTGTIEPDVDAEWNRFTRLRETTGKTVHLNDRTKPSVAFYAMRIAAVVIPAILILSAALFISKKNHTLQSTWVTVTSGNQQLVQQLPDGTEACLNKNTSMAFPKKFGKERLVRLTGEAFFKVTKLGKPFIVNAGSTSVKVLGTHFNVKNYPNAPSIQVFVEEGSVLFSDTQNSNNKVVLKPGEMGLYKDSSQPIEKIRTTNGTAWLTQKLRFENVALNVVKSDISNYFGQNVVLPAQLRNCLFTGEFNKPELTDMLNVISLSVGCSFKIVNDTIYFQGEGCN